MLAGFRQRLTGLFAIRLYRLGLVVFTVSAGFLYYTNFIGMNELLFTIEVTIALVAIIFELDRQRLEDAIFRATMSLSPTELKLMRSIADNPKTLRVIANGLDLNLANTNLVISRLESQGCVERYNENGKTYYRLSNRGHSTVSLYT